ncbi:hypothetical protein B0H15DRAFT_480928 [Mycena belliarum]|uniref:Methyltransferase domain-containing protein n=1 Tax=Mycena belliarum TaxID=1033014 RepID=A0AAD6XMQ7_9AGAR|nr:hypothetical protein B0H15DRAFT_480928 [Mycena belliae]
MSSRAASGRKRLRPIPAATIPVPSLPAPTPKSKSKFNFSRPTADANGYQSAPPPPQGHAFPTASAPSPSIMASSSQRRDFPPLQGRAPWEAELGRAATESTPTPYRRPTVNANGYQSAPPPPQMHAFPTASAPSPSMMVSSSKYTEPPPRDFAPLRARAPSAAAFGRNINESTQYPQERQGQVYQPPPLRREKAGESITTHSNSTAPDSRSPPPTAPSYHYTRVRHADVRSRSDSAPPARYHSPAPTQFHLEPAPVPTSFRSDDEAGEARRRPRALPPPPPTSTLATAEARPPSYGYAPHEEEHGKQHQNGSQQQKYEQTRYQQQQNGSRQYEYPKQQYEHHQQQNGSQQYEYTQQQHYQVSSEKPRFGFAREVQTGIGHGVRNGNGAVRYEPAGSKGNGNGVVQYELAATNGAPRSNGASEYEYEYPVSSRLQREGTRDAQSPYYAPPVSPPARFAPASPLQRTESPSEATQTTLNYAPTSYADYAPPAPSYSPNSPYSYNDHGNYAHAPTPAAPYLRPQRSFTSSMVSRVPSFAASQTSVVSSPFTSVASLRPHGSRVSLSSSSDSTGRSRGSSGSRGAASTHSGASSVGVELSPTTTTSPDTPTTATSPTFVFPSSRSRARPSPTASSPGFKFRGRRKVKPQVLPPGTPLPAEGVFTAQAPPQSNRPPDLRLPRKVSTSTAGSGSSGSTGATAPPTFYFPSARTRAHPKSPKQFLLKVKKEKGKEGGRGFLRLGFRKAVAAPSPPAEEAHGGMPAPEEQPVEGAQPRGLEERYGAGTPTTLAYDDDEEDDVPASPQVVTKIGAYPLDAYDATLMESDRQTWELLRTLTARGSPTFHAYGARPPQRVLDMGCGAGSWMLDAATAWRNNGVQIVGFDMVDTTKGMWPVAERRGIADNLKFVRGNFVKAPLPFEDGTFDLVRMVGLALCVPHERWEGVMREVWRVLSVDGRLELVDDALVFPYGKAPPLSPPPQSQLQFSSGPTPQLDMTIPSAAFSRMSVVDVVHPRVREHKDSEIYDLYGVQEEEDAQSDAETIGSGHRRTRGVSTPQTRSSTPTQSSSSSRSSLLSRAPSGPDPEVWHGQAASAREIEALFEHMLSVKYGIHLRPVDFVGELLARVFGPGGAREVAPMHLTLAPPEHAQERPPSLRSRSRAREMDTLTVCPGLMLWPSTFLPLPPAELEAHASKHLRVLLSCKAALVDYAAELADAAEGETQGEAAMEALWEYQNFLRERFNPPTEEAARAASDASSAADDVNSIRESVFSVSSVGTEARDAMQEYQNELHTRFEWTSDAPRDVSTPIPASTPPPMSAPRVDSPAASESTGTSVQPRKTRRRGSRGRDRASSAVSSVASQYSRVEMTHVRTFHVYEAVKLADGRF